MQYLKPRNLFQVQLFWVPWQYLPLPPLGCFMLLPTCSATSLNHPLREREQSPFHYWFQMNHLFWPQVTTSLSLPSLLLLQHWSETAALPGQSTPAESQNPHSGWGHSSSGFRNWCPDSVHAEDSVQRQHRAHNRSPGKHRPGLWQVKTFLSRGHTGSWCDWHTELVNSDFISVLFVFKPPSFGVQKISLKPQGTSRLIRDPLLPPTQCLSCCVTALSPSLTAKPWLQLLASPESCETKIPNTRS